MEPPDSTEKTIRFGCGFIFGLLVTGLSGFLWFVTSGHYVVAVSLLSALICGVLALRYGDRFWHWLSSWVWWAMVVLGSGVALAYLSRLATS